MNFVLTAIFNFSILIAGIAAIIRYKRIHKRYYPFLYFIWLGCINEILSFFLIMKGFHTFINNNIYVLAESLLLVYFFKKSGVFKKTNRLFLIIVSGLVILWIYENLVMHKIVSVSEYFRIVYSFVLVLLSIITINSLISTVRKNIFTNADFLICVSFIIYYTYKILVEAFWLYGLNSSLNFQWVVYYIMIYMNLVCNLIYTLAIIWMPRKQIFTMPS